MIERTSDPALVNDLLGRDFEGIDATEFLANPLNVCLIEDGDGIMFAWRGPRIYEAHVFYRSRGRAALDRTNAFLGLMRSNYGARLFWALIPVESRRVRMFTRLLGWLSQGQVETQHGPQELFVSEIIPCLQHS